MSKMAVLQEIDKCIRCRGCMVACQRNFANDTLDVNDGTSGTEMALSAEPGDTAERIGADDVTVVKAQVNIDFPPYVKYGCWQCGSPPCATACPRGAISKQPDGSVYIRRASAYFGDNGYCDPSLPVCYDKANRLKCVSACPRGGYPVRGLGDGASDKIWKCDMCYGRRVPGFISNATGAESAAGEVPACVATCPAKALKYGTWTDINQYVASQGYPYVAGGTDGGSIFWAKKSAPFGNPTADPLVEDHMTPMLQAFLESPLGKMLLIPTVMAGGLYALYARRLKVESEETKVS